MSSYIENETEKFTQVNGETCVRMVGEAGASGSILSHVENGKEIFVDNSKNEVAQRVKISN